MWYHVRAHCFRVGALSLLLACNGAGAGGTIVVRIESTQPVDRVQLKVFDAQGANREYPFEALGHDLTKEKVAAEISPGALIAGGRILIVGLGYYSTAPAPVTSGRAEATFQPNQRVTVVLSLHADVVDDDRDG